MSLTDSFLPCRQWHYNANDLFCEQVKLADLARDFGTPLYVYSKEVITDAYKAYTRALANHPHLICYAVKANSNIAILQLLANLGCGFDIVSGGELVRVLHAGGDAKKITFSGVAKTEPEIELALKVGIKCFNVESIPELSRIETVARRIGLIAPISVRVNPDVDAHTHPYISTGLKNNKFGVDYAQCVTLYRYAHQSQWLRVQGIDSHIGSQLTDMAPYLDACDKILDLVCELHDEGIELEHIDFGGGVGVRYRDENTINIPELAHQLRCKMLNRNLGHLCMIFEPGRSMIANAGVLLTTVQYIKRTPVKNFLIVDAGMTEMIRPALYEAWMPILPIKKLPEINECCYDIVGPVCESSDWLGKERTLKTAPGQCLAIAVAGAYGMSMSSNYNSRAQIAEILVDGNKHFVIRRRQNIEDTWQQERLL